MKCDKCDKVVSIDSGTPGKFCDKCFLTVIEKRVRKSLGKVFFKDAKVLVVGDLAEYFVRNVVGGLLVKITKRNKIPSDFSNFDLVVVEETMDDVDSDFLTNFFGKKAVIKNNDKIVKILKSITDEEAIRFAKVKKIKFKINSKNEEINNFLKKISEKHPEIKYNLLKNVSEVGMILDKSKP